MGEKIKPVFISEEDLSTFENNNNIFLKKDLTEIQIKELKEITFNSNPDFSNQWVYFSWSGSLYNILDEVNFTKLRTNRNRDLITEKEQETLYEAKVAIAGLSVGSGLALELQYSGISSNIKLAEDDILETTNLNRIKASIGDVGTNKIESVLKRIYEINPYSKATDMGDRVNPENINLFFENPKPDIIFEIIDDYEMKIRIRLVAREMRIPVVSFANLGDSVLVDIERFDIDKKTPLFNGVIGDYPEKILENPNDKDNFHAINIVGRENVPEKAIESVKQIGKTLVGRPQLSATVAVSSSIGAYIAREIILGDKKLTGRNLIKFEDFFRE